MSDPFRNLGALYEKVQVHSDRVMDTYAGKFKCRRGCSDCCSSDRSVSAVEYANVENALSELPEKTLSRLRSLPGSKKSCSMLLDGACTVYKARPLICRGHGLPLVLERSKGRQFVDVCPLNFTDGSLATLPPEDLLAQGTVDSILVAVNALYCQEEGGEPRKRRQLASLLE
ncbi:MAG: Fe-S-cluster containining protein [Cognaticolwellia sp.]|jgi:Fe-S-cluster containining protein